MRVLLMRHGAAVRSGPYSDFDRPLTPEGSAGVRQAARGLKRLGVRPERLVSSPARRCEETVRLVTKALGVPASRVERRDAFAGGSPATKLLADLAEVCEENPSSEEVFVVGHEPDLVALASLLLSKEGRVRLRFEPAGCACFELEPPPLAGNAVLVWLLEPEQLAQLGVEP